MLTLLEEIPEVIQRYLDRHCNGGISEGFSKKVFKADSGWCLIYRYSDNSGYNVCFFGEDLPDNRGHGPYIYANEDAKYDNPDVDIDYYEKVFYGYYDDYDPNRFYICDTIYTKSDIKTWIRDEFSNYTTRESSFDYDSALEGFMDSVGWDSFMGSGIIQTMVDNQVYPFNLVKQVNWLN